MEKYKFRAECEHDVTQLKQLISFDIESIDVAPLSTTYSLPDVVVTPAMDSIHLEQLRDYMHLVDDSHVMVETLAKEHEYTGERNYGL